MARESNRLSATKVKSLTNPAASPKPGRYPDGDGLYLCVDGRGWRYWVFRYRTGKGQRRDKGLGQCSAVTLAEARRLRDECRALLKAGKDPIDTPREQEEADRRQREADEAAQRLAAARAVTFSDACTRYIAAHGTTWRNAKHRQQWENTLRVYCAPINDLPVSEIDRALVLQCLQPIWTEKTETATRLRQRIEAVLDWAEQAELRSGQNPARWKGVLDKLLPEPTKLKRQALRHHPALPYVDIHPFVVDLRTREGLAPKALELLILTASRCGEVVGMRWSELDLEAAEWTVPGERMKAHREHRVPLASRAVTILRSLPRVSDYVFPGSGRKQPHIHANLLLMLTKELRPGQTVHGFRSTFRDWCAEQTNFPREIAEAALAHTLKDKTEAAYRRTDLFDKRRRLMEAWAAYIETPKATANITPLRAKKSGS